jgi:nucleoside-diphosphate-sugar epimerase
MSTTRGGRIEVAAYPLPGFRATPCIGHARDAKVHLATERRLARGLLRYLVTGGAGFIGSHICEALIRAGHSVHVLDDLSTGSLSNVGSLVETAEFQSTIGSARDPRLVDALVADADGVFHLAAAVGVELIVESPVSTIETNVYCAEVVLAAASRHQTPVLTTSTSEVYGKGNALPFREDGDLTLGPSMIGRWAYACSKAIDEFLAIAYWKERGLPVVVARLFNTVGPRQSGRYGMVLPRLVGQALSNQPLTVFGEGRQRRCFCHVEDVVQALVDLFVDEQSFGEIVNVGSQEEVSILELARRVIDVTNSASSIALIPYEEAYEEGFEDMHRRVPDISKIERMIGWRPSRSLDEIILDVATAQQPSAIV